MQDLVKTLKGLKDHLERNPLRELPVEFKPYEIVNTTFSMDKDELSLRTYYGEFITIHRTHIERIIAYAEANNLLGDN